MFGFFMQEVRPFISFLIPGLPPFPLMGIFHTVSYAYVFCAS